MTSIRGDYKAKAELSIRATVGTPLIVSSLSLLAMIHLIDRKQLGAAQTRDLFTQLPAGSRLR